MRLDIEDIDHDDIKLKLNAAVAKTTDMQSAEKKRIVAQDAESFNKYVSLEKNPGKNPGNTRTTQDASRTYQSPADITANRSSALTESKSDSVQSPRTSPRVPENSYQFQTDWKTVKNDLDRSYEFLKV